MSLEALLITLLIGGIAGWLAGLVVKGRGLGVLGNIVVGIVGAFIGSWVLARLGVVLVGGYPGAILNAFIGAVILLILIGLIKKT